MTTTTQPSAAPTTQPPPGAGTWTFVLAGVTTTVAIVDVLFFAIIREVIPPLAVGVALTVVGVALLRTRRRAGTIVVGLTSAVMLAGGLGFATAHFGHPESGVDWAHAVIGSAGRVLAIAAAVAAWRGGSEHAARRTGASALGALGLVLTVALVTTVATSGDAAEPDDVTVTVERALFPEGLVVSSGEVLHVDNRDLVRHTFTVEGTDVDVELPARQGVRVPIDLATGTYELVCEIPGHEAMTSTLTVR
jgi:plastocyanin